MLQGSGGVRASTLLSVKDLAGVPAVRADGRKRQRAVRKATVMREKAKMELQAKGLELGRFSEDRRVREEKRGRGRAM